MTAATDATRAERIDSAAANFIQTIVNTTRDPDGYAASMLGILAILRHAKKQNGRLPSFLGEIEKVIVASSGGEL